MGKENLMSSLSARCTIMRGGTSKGVFLREESLPSPGPMRDAMILELMGSPDPMQIDGMGGTHSTTSKLVAVSSSTRSDCDIDYLFAQVAVEKPVVDYGGNCGNLTSAVGPYAINEDLVEVVEPITTVRLYNKNTCKCVNAHVPVQHGRAQVFGDHHIAGVPGSGAKIILDFLDPAGSTFGRAFPTGQPIDQVKIQDRSIEVSFVDITNPLAFVRAIDIDMCGDESPTEVNGDPKLLARIEELRGICAYRLGLVDDPARAAYSTPGMPKLAFVSPPHPYATSDGKLINGDDFHILARIMSMQRMHPAYSLTGIMCTAAASCLEGTIPYEVAGGDRSPEVRIGHPKGLAEATVLIGDGDNATSVRQISVTRTARHLMAGDIFYRSTGTQLPHNC